MHTLRQMYFARCFRWTPEDEMFETVGEAETFDFLANPHCYEALSAAHALDLEWSDDAEDWFRSVEHWELQVAIEQCCHNGELLPTEVRALRLQRFSHSEQVRTESMLDDLPEDHGASALALICWWVRIERAKRTGSPNLDPNRSVRLGIPDRGGLDQP